MRDSQNIKDLLSLRPDYMGFIFYEKSPRNAEEGLDTELLKSIPSSTEKVGVFVNASFDFIMERVSLFELDMIQLHGEESVDLVKQLKVEGLEVVKVFGVNDEFDFAQIQPYKAHVDFFLFDTKSKQRGGTGVQFNWEKLKEYDQEVPFFLSGGISNENIAALDGLKCLNIYAIDVNSKYEIEPGLKDIEKIKELVNVIPSLRNESEGIS